MSRPLLAADNPAKRAGLLAQIAGDMFDDVALAAILALACSREDREVLAALQKIADRHETFGGMAPLFVRDIINRPDLWP